jgi:hypothetical protein
MSAFEPGVAHAFRLQRYLLRLGAFSTVLFTLAPVISVVGISLDEPPPRRPVLLAVVFVVGYSFPLGLGVWMVLSYLRKSITVTGDEVCIRGMTKLCTIQLGQVMRARWYPDSLSLTLFLAASKHTVKFAELRHGSRLLRYFREHIRPEAQENWGPVFEAYLAIADQVQNALKATCDWLWRWVWWISTPLLLLFSGVAFLDLSRSDWVLAHSTGSVLGDVAAVIFLSAVGPWGALRIFKWTMEPE